MENNNKRTLITIVLLLVAVVVAAVVISRFSQTTPSIPYSELVERLVIDEEDEKPDDLVVGLYFVSSYEARLLFKGDIDKLDDFKKGKFVSATCIVMYRDNLLEKIDLLGIVVGEGTYVTDTPVLNEDGSPKFVEIEGVPTPVYEQALKLYIKLNNPAATSIMDYLFPALSLIVLVGLGVFMFISMKKAGGTGGAMSFAKTKARVSQSVKVRFNDVAGAEEEKEELKEIVDFLKAPKKFKAVGARIPKGVLLVGQPGTGKTLFAKAVAGEAGVPFFSISGSDFVEMFVGVGASRVRDLFAQAKKAEPCIVFIDEIDAVGRKRGAGLGGGNDEREQTLNQLLVQMDGFNENDGIVIIAATNRVDVLDPALLRPGRFDRQVYVHLPDVRGREGIFKVHARNKPMAPDVDFMQVARITTGFSGADIENVLNEAAILAARANRFVILMRDIEEGITKVVAGPQKKSRLITERDKRITAYHEAGHAIIGKKLKNCEEIQEVSIIPRGMAAGYNLTRSKNDDEHVSKNKLLDGIAMSLGGRASEEIIIQDISTGASQDLKQSTGTARRMVQEWGMSDALPNIFFGGEQEVFIGRDYQTQSPYSEHIAQIIDDEVRKIIDAQYARAKSVLLENIDALHNTVKLLFAEETIYGDELDMILNGKSVEEVQEYIKTKKAEQERIAEERRKQAEDEEKRRQEEQKRQAELVKAMMEGKLDPNKPFNPPAPPTPPSPPAEFKWDNQGSVNKTGEPKDEPKDDDSDKE